MSSTFGNDREGFEEVCNRILDLISAESKKFGELERKLNPAGKKESFDSENRRKSLISRYRATLSTAEPKDFDKIYDTTLRLYKTVIDKLKKFLLLQKPPSQDSYEIQDSCEIYDPAKHLLLNDYAHRGLMITQSEVENYIHNVINDSRLKGIRFFVNCPEFPPVKRQQARLHMSIGRGKVKDPFEKYPWVGEQPAVEKCHQNKVVLLSHGMRENQTRGEKYQSYIYQIPIFDSKQHLKANDFCDADGIEIKPRYFYNSIRQGFGGLKKKDLLVKTTNPDYQAKMEKIEHKIRLAKGKRVVISDDEAAIPFIRCIYKKHLGAFIEKFNLSPESVSAYVDGLPEEESPHPFAGEIIRPELPQTKQKAEELDEYDEVVSPTKKQIEHQSFKTILTNHFGQFKMFGDQFLDKSYKVLSEKELIEFLTKSSIDKHVRVDEFQDCDDFALMLKAEAGKLGINSCGIIFGDGHAWNFFVVALPNNEYKVVHVEPQTDTIIPDLSGEYSITKRLDLYV